MAKEATSEIYRVIIVFPAESAKVAKTKADLAVKSVGVGAKLDRITVQRLTWGPLVDDESDES